ncbi:MAG: hypothetical protein DME25_17435 [Verrucomicrobia bacterium]|nr:MAG: hypothetical protein DME25_17435 [Verrucomicrobiota bacterium]
MIFIAALLNKVLTFLFGLVYVPLKWLGPFWSLVGISWLAGILLVWMFGKVSNQDAIRRTRDRLSGELIGLRLFKDDLRVFFGIQFQVLLWTFRYLRHSLVPMLILMVPTIFILIQLNYHYGLRPLRVGEQAVVKVKLRDAAALARDIDFTLTAPENLKIETDGLRIPELKEICWRIRGVSPGRFDVSVSDGQKKVTKQAAVGGRLEGVSSLRTGENWLTSLLYPGEAPIPQRSAIESIEIRYPELDILFLGRRVNWLILFLILSLGLGYAFKGMLGVQI